MRKLLLFLFLSILASCKKNTEIPVPDLKVTNEIIGIDKPLHAVDDSIMVTIVFSVFPVDATPVVMISCNNKKPYALDTTSYEEDRQVTAWLPAAGKVGENEILLSVHSGDKEYKFTKVVRVIENNDLENWWPALDYETVENSFPLYYETGSSSAWIPLINGKHNIFGIGLTSKQSMVAGQLYQKRTLINGFNGRYHLDYDADKKLKRVRVENGNTLVDPRLTFDKVLEEISAYYGDPVEVQGDSYARFEIGDYMISVTEEQDAEISTAIILK